MTGFLQRLAQRANGSARTVRAASGAQFSLLPPDNATGNFTKVVQRIPVKLTFAADNPLRGKIRPGMSVTAKVNIKDAPEYQTTKVSSKDTLDDGR